MRAGCGWIPFYPRLPLPPRLDGTNRVAAGKKAGNKDHEVANGLHCGRPSLQEEARSNCPVDRITPWGYVVSSRAQLCG
jgi:hypothetical protein